MINPYPDNEMRRKLVGTAGRKIKLLTNHFDMPKITKTVFIYEIIFEFPWKGLRKRQKPLHYRCMEMVKQSHAGKVSLMKTFFNHFKLVIERVPEVRFSGADKFKLNFSQYF